MENRCQRCNRKLSDPNANYGWRCAEILGVSSELSEMGTDIFKKFTDGVTKVQKLFENSNFTDEQWKNLYSAFAKMSLWEGVNESKVKGARKEGYQVVNLSKTKSKSFSDSLNEYKEYVDKYGIITGISKKLANEGKLDDVTNKVLKKFDEIQSDYTMSPSIQSIVNYENNKKVDLSSYKDGYINDQNSGAVSKLRF